MASTKRNQVVEAVVIMTRERLELKQPEKFVCHGQMRKSSYKISIKHRRKHLYRSGGYTFAGQPWEVGNLVITGTAVQLRVTADDGRSGTPAKIVEETRYDIGAPDFVEFLEGWIDSKIRPPAYPPPARPAQSSHDPQAPDPQVPWNLVALAVLALAAFGFYQLYCLITT